MMNIVVLHKKLTESGYQVNIDTIYKAARKRQASIKLAERLEHVTGIERSMWIWPRGDKSPWDLYRNGSDSV